jgi:four helix bundle protein
MQNYKDLKVWQKAHLFTLQVYECTRAFPKDELYSLTNQLRRAASSVPANIAEGCGKNPNNELAHFLNIALGSSNETEYFLIFSKDLKHLSENIFIELEIISTRLKQCLSH